MTQQAFAWALRQRTGSSELKGLLLGLAIRADRDGAWADLQQLTAITEMTGADIARCMRQLQALGLVTIRYRRSGERLSLCQVLMAGRP